VGGNFGTADLETVGAAVPKADEAETGDAGHKKDSFEQGLKPRVG